MTIANNLDPDDTPQNVGAHSRSKSFHAKGVFPGEKPISVSLFQKFTIQKFNSLKIEHS